MSGILHKQTHAPPIECEQRAMREARRRRGGTDLPRDTWVTRNGWCSACKRHAVDVAHMGTAAFNFALCRQCIDALDATLVDGEDS